MVGTCKTNFSVHPGAILQNNCKPRHTKQQIEKDKAEAAALAIMAEKDAAAKYQSVRTRIAELQVAVEMEEQEVSANTLRPDLREG
jgi:hypothetical protein